MHPLPIQPPARGVVTPPPRRHFGVAWRRGWLVVGLVVGLLLPQRGSGQGYFNERYANSATTYQSALGSVIVTDSGYVGVGVGANYPFRFSNALMVRFLRPDGQQYRVRYFGRQDYYYFCTPQGGGLLAVPGGYAMQGGVDIPGGAQKAMLWRFDALGDSLWTRSYGSPDGNARIAYSMCRARDGGYALTGTADVRLTPFNADVWLLRTDSLGTVMWSRTYNFGSGDDGYSIVSAPDGGFLIGGSVEYLQGGGNYDGLVIKVDSVGQEQWRRTFGGNFYDGIANVRVLADNNYLIGTSRTVSALNGFTQRRIALHKLSPQGVTLWQREYGPKRDGVQVFAMHELASGALVVAGGTEDTTGATPVGNGFPMGYALKVCADGDSVWYRTYRHFTGGRSHNYLRDFRPTPDGGFVGCGFLFGRAPDPVANDAWAFKTDSAGYLLPGGAPPTVRCPRPLGLAPAAAAEPGIAIWPNPATGTVRVRLAEAGPAVLLDAVGRVVRATRAAAGQELTWDVAALPAGLYVVRAGGQTRRLVVAR
ncbi:MAG: T9SS type A sorting domain-containing protein [Hymenobacteraceae bacterium]|nr:T9SS type A sorting domain-containing protein [Hymenobacteraceae bacterium]